MPLVDSVLFMRKIQSILSGMFNRQEARKLTVINRMGNSRQRVEKLMAADGIRLGTLVDLMQAAEIEAEITLRWDDGAASAVYQLDEKMDKPDFSICGRIFYEDGKYNAFLNGEQLGTHEDSGSALEQLQVRAGELKMAAITRYNLANAKSNRAAAGADASTEDARTPAA